MKPTKNPDSHPNEFVRLNPNDVVTEQHVCKQDVPNANWGFASSSVGRLQRTCHIRFWKQVDNTLPQDTQTTKTMKNPDTHPNEFVALQSEEEITTGCLCRSSAYKGEWVPANSSIGKKQNQVCYTFWKPTNGTTTTERSRSMIHNITVGATPKVAAGSPPASEKVLIETRQVSGKDASAAILLFGAENAEKIVDAAKDHDLRVLCTSVG